jgi:ATP-dependent RNA helicase DDX24/MAK5
MSSDWDNYDLNEKIITNLTEECKFDSPTDIQKRVLQYINSKVDLIIQARTGEGKTLCYGLPIINYILNLYEKAEDKIKTISPVALIIVPTRELGLQVSNHLSAILKDLTVSEGNKFYHNIKIVNVLGGFAKPKQIKILNKYKPEIIIATPGRLWEIMENEESPLLSKFYKLRYLVLDEADRMTEKGHFRELKNIIQHIYTKLETVDLRKVKEDENEENFLKKKINSLTKGEKVKDNKEENKKLQKALKKRGLNVKMDDIEEIDPLEMFQDEDNLIDNFNLGEEEEGDDEDGEGEEIEECEENEIFEGEDDQEQEVLEGDDELNDDEEMLEEEIENDDENEDDQDENENEDIEDEENILDERKLKKMKKDEDKIQEKVTPKHQIHLRTFLCSATIEQMHQKEKFRKGKKPKPKQEDPEDQDKVNLDNLVKNIKFYNKLMYVRNQRDQVVNPEEEEEDNIEQKRKSTVLPEKLELDCYKCESTIKDYYLLHILRENEGKSIVVFTNSISHTKKIFSIFSFFDFKLTVLHSKMQQSQRIKNLDRFRKKESNILFCTDVGARGLDIPMVDIVIHYHIPKTTEPFIHRSGRTARAHKEGTCISLISEAELSTYKRIMKDIKIREFGMKTLSVIQLEKYKSLFEFTKKVEKEDHSIKKKNRERQWFEKRANECEMLFDEDDYDLDKRDDEEIEKEKFLNKKRKQIQKTQFQDKKVFHKITTNNIKRTSFLTSDMVAKLNGMIGSSDSMKEINLTKAIYDANMDAQAFRYKGKQKKKRYQRRRGGK